MMEIIKITTNENGEQLVRRMKELKETPFFADAYQEVTTNEVYIDTNLYDEYIKWRSHNRRKGTKYIEPLDWLKGVRQ